MTDPKLLKQYGPFCACLFVKDPAYFGFLHLGDVKTTAAMQVVDEACAKPDAILFAPHLLTGEPNWRPHLIGAAAALILKSEPMTTALWDAIDSGSWVAPQLIATAYLVDPDFVTSAKTRMDVRCIVEPQEDMNPIERHLATGPAEPNERAQKNFTALLGMCRQIEDCTGWLQEIGAAETVAEWKEQNPHFFEDWGEFALDWLEKLKQAIAVRGMDLQPAFETSGGVKT